MFIELVGSLRCVREHELTWLVASAYRMEDRDIVSGELGCPECGARYPVEYGVADFRELGSASVSPHTLVESPERGRLPASPEQQAPPPLAGVTEVDDPGDQALRVAALLDLSTPGGMVVLAGSWSAAAGHLAGSDMVERVHILALDPLPGIVSGGGISLALTRGLMPVRPSAARGIALDAAHASPSYLASAAAALRPGARLLAPVDAPLPEGLIELARDDKNRLASKPGTPSPVIRLERSKDREAGSRERL